jgi:hypothetical protein
MSRSRAAARWYVSQSMNAEIPRKALLVATIPAGTDKNAVMLVGIATASWWRKGADSDMIKTVETFCAIPAPKTNRKLRAENRSNALDFKARAVQNVSIYSFVYCHAPIIHLHPSNVQRSIIKIHSLLHPYLSSPPCEPTLVWHH